MAAKITFTESQINELRSLVQSGMRQMDIAKHFGVTDDTVRKICKENSIDVKMPHKCICILCGEEFYSNVKGAKTCKKEHHRSCIICGKDFIVDRTNIRETCSPECSSLLKYGTKHPSAALENILKRKQAIKDKYGVDNVSQLSDHAEKSKQTCLQKYGSESYAGSKQGRESTRKTNLARYGCEEPLANPEFRERCYEINLEKYGTIHPMQTEEIQDKFKATMFAKYGVANPMQVPEIVDRLAENNVSKFGFKYASQNSDIKKKTSETCKERFGVPWACMREEARNFNARSKLNKEFEDFLKNNGINADVEFALEEYSFDFKIGQTLIEIDPSITHNSFMSIFKGVDPKSSTYHITKSKCAENAGYCCIHVFDWDRWDDIISLFASTDKIFARNCEIRNVSLDVSDKFIDGNHIQGKCRGTELSFGLYYKSELVQVMTFGRPRYTAKYDFELLRLCTKQGLTVVGGSSKLFKHFIKLNPGKSVISYCDSAKFSGKVYEKMGMKLDHVTEPAKVWSKGNQKITDNLLRQRGYDQLFRTNYGKGTSNEELMIENGWLPVYDCGQKVFVY